MVNAIHDWLLPAALDRAVLLANHVLSGEPAATQRLAPHAGRVVRVQATGWPALLPAWPPVDLRLTAAGLLERVEQGEGLASGPDLQLGVDATNPALLAWNLAAGVRPAVQVVGDAALAADVDWVATNVRWDVQADLERVLGPGPAQALAGLVAALAQALGEAARAWPAKGPADPGRASPSGGASSGPATGPEGMR
jgi:ubiquinone biosynthesis protein UbiJ